MSLIHIENLSKHFKILNRREGLRDAFRSVFTYVIPIGFVVFYPSQLYLYWIWTKGVNSYTGTGS